MKTTTDTEAIQAAYEKWSVVKGAIVAAASDLVNDPLNDEARRTMAGLLAAEKIAKNEFEGLLNGSKR